MQGWKLSAVMRGASFYQICVFPNYSEEHWALTQRGMRSGG